MQVIPPNNNSTCHLCGHNLSSQNTTTNRNVTSEWTLLIYLELMFKLQYHLRESSNRPMYVPLMASVGVLKPKPTSLNHRLSFVAIFRPPKIKTKVQKIRDIFSNTSTYHGLLHSGKDVAFGRLFLPEKMIVKVKLNLH